MNKKKQKNFIRRGGANEWALVQAARILRCWGGRPRDIAKRAKVWLLKVKHGAVQIELKGLMRNNRIVI